METNGATEQWWVTVYEGHGAPLAVTSSRQVLPGRRLRVGREGDLLAGVRPSNPGISRDAVDLTATEAGWRIEVRNRNGAFLHPWAQPPLAATRDTTLSWPQVGVRLLHDSPTAQHWVLLSADLAVTPAGPTSSLGVAPRTAKAKRPSNPLPKGQRDALAMVFGELLRWPPQHPATPLQLKQAAPRLGISVSGLQGRLGDAWERAVQLGMARGERDLTDPGYLYVLVRGGYLGMPAGGLCYAGTRSGDEPGVGSPA